MAKRTRKSAAPVAAAGQLRSMTARAGHADSKKATIDAWQGMYRDGWAGVIVDDAFSHPAKFSRSLIQRIYAHLAECKAIWPGAVVLDPFGGVALGGLDAMFHGCQWIGCELEPRFAALGAQNIELWNQRHKAGWPGWGRAQLLQGDSRRLREVVQGCEAIVSSPPFLESLSSGTLSEEMKAEMRSRGHKPSASGEAATYGTTAGNLGNLREGDFAAVVASPPFASSIAGEPRNPEHASVLAQQQRGENNTAGGKFGRSLSNDYGQTPGQLGAMKEGQIDAVLSSPPYAESNVTGQSNFTGGGGNETPASALRKGVAAVISSPPFQGAHDGTTNETSMRPPHDSTDALRGGYGTSPGQLGSMRDAGFDAVVSSPPYESAQTSDANSKRQKDSGYFAKSTNGKLTGSYADVPMDSPGQLGAEQGDTFWTAARQIVTECYHLLRPGGVAVWVTKGFVRKKKYVDFPGQWRQLCEAVGFKTLHEHQAMLVVDQGTQHTLWDGPEKMEKRRESFFRRLARKNGAPGIDFECVTCMVKPNEPRP